MDKRRKNNRGLVLPEGIKIQSNVNKGNRGSILNIFIAKAHHHHHYNDDDYYDKGKIKAFTR